MFQSYALFPNMTVARNVAYGLESQRRSRADVRDRVRELLDLVGLPDQGDKYPAQLSGGQQQRIALARAIAMSPGLLLLDEPLSALDAKVRARLRYEVKALQRRLGITTIMVTHDQEEALTMADRIVVMNHGVIEQVGAPVEIYREPASVFVADFIGTMNFLPAEITGDAGTGAAGSGRGGSPLPAIPPATRRASGSPPPFGPRTSSSWTPGVPRPPVMRTATGLRCDGRVRRVPRLVRARRARLRGRAPADGPVHRPGSALRRDGGKHRAGSGPRARRCASTPGRRPMPDAVTRPVRRFPRAGEARGWQESARSEFDPGRSAMAEAVLAAPAVKPKFSRDDWTMRAFIGVIGLYLVVTLAMPLYAMMSKSVRNDDGVFVGLANYIEYFATPALTWSIGNSLQVAAITTFITVTIGFTFAYALTRSCIPLKGCSSRSR